MFHRMHIIIEISIITFYPSPPELLLSTPAEPVCSNYQHNCQSHSATGAVRALVNPSTQPLPKLLRFWAAEEYMSGFFFMLMTETEN